jgi:hypothetical protein
LAGLHSLTTPGRHEFERLEVLPHGRRFQPQIPLERTSMAISLRPLRTIV